jgi:hypothetical protein
MRVFMLSAAILASAGSDAASACHRYAVWRYPHAQSCGVSVRRVVHRAPVREARLLQPEDGAEAKVWRVEIIKDPPALADLPSEVGRLFELGRLREADEMRVLLPGAQ